MCVEWATGPGEGEFTGVGWSGVGTSVAGPSERKLAGLGWPGVGPDDGEGGAKVG